jgi:hypothetical protein
MSKGHGDMTDSAPVPVPVPIPIRFVDDERVADVTESLSTVTGEGRCLWLAGDETVAIERTTLVEGGAAFGDHVSFPISDFLPLPEHSGSDGTAPEIDIEGMARDGGYLWFVGSHSLTRKRVKPNHVPDVAMARLAKVTKNDNRYLLGRIPVVEVDGLPTLVPTAPDPAGAAHTLTAAATGLRKKTRITEALDDDDHLSRFLKIPSKDNGFDVEGLAVVGERIYLGLRGPVLRGWAVVLEIRLVEGDGQDLILGPVEGRQVYRKHFLNLGGLGVRDLLAYGEDLLVLAGPTMDLDGPVRVYGWRGAAQLDAGVVVTSDDLEHVMDVPYGDGDDHAEGITLMPGDEGSLLVVYDSPAPHRRGIRHEILADVIPLPRLPRCPGAVTDRREAWSDAVRRPAVHDRSSTSTESLPPAR